MPARIRSGAPLISRRLLTVCGPSSPEPTSAGSPLQQFTIASRDLTAPFDRTVQAVESLRQSIPDARIVRLDREIGVAVVEVPDRLANQLRASLGDNFMVDPNPPLRY